MIGDLFKGSLEFLKLAPRHLAAPLFVCAVLLFGPDPLLRKLGLAQLADDYRPWLGLAFLASTALVVVPAVGGFLRRSRSRRQQKKIAAHIRERLSDLTEAEKQILRFYIVKQTRTNVLRVDDGVVQGLVSEAILYRAANMGSIAFGFAFNIGDVAWKHLNENKRLLEGETNTMRTDSAEDFFPRFW